MCSLERESVQLIIHRLWTIGTSCCVQDSDRWCNKQHCTTTTPLVTEPLFASLFSVTCFRSNFCPGCPSRYRISNLHVGESVYDSKSSSQKISSWSWIKKAYYFKYLLMQPLLALLNNCLFRTIYQSDNLLQSIISSVRFTLRPSN